MKETDEQLPFAGIGEWMRKTIKALKVTNELLINASGIRREVFYDLLKGGTSSTAIGYVFSSPLWICSAMRKKRG